VEASAIDLPLRKAEKAVDAYRFAAASLPEPSSQLAIGGQSYGGRVASLLVAQASDDWAGLVLFSYPLHRPGQLDWDERSRHWPSITLPVLMLSGESDPFAKIELLRRAVDERLTGARVVTYPRQGHSLKAVVDEALDEVASFMADLRPTDAKA
jgi:predicted alpha/beta-hydrolase family hydrolase